MSIMATMFRKVTHQPTGRDPSAGPTDTTPVTQTKQKILIGSPHTKRELCMVWRVICLTSLPSEAGLYQMYERFRSSYFRDGDRLLIPPSQEVTIEWSNRLTASAGVCYPKRRIIRLSPYYHRTHPDDVESTLLHEMIHLIVSGHGSEFYAWLESIQRQGGRVARYAKTRATVEEPPRWKYRCIECGYEFPRYRRLRHGGRDYLHKGCGGRLMEVPLYRKG